MSNYIIGIDGGGTKTLGVLWDQNGNELKRYQTGFSSFVIDDALTRKHLEETIENLKEDIEGNLTIIMGVAGYSVLKDETEYNKYLEEKYNATVKITSDGYLALYSVVENPEEPVIMIIGGTGSIVYSLVDEKVEKMGGFGHLLGDEGSAYHLVIESFKYMVKYYEAHGYLDHFGQEMFRRLNIEKLDDLKPLVYGVNKSNIARHAINVSSIAEQGNKVAIDLLKTEGESLAIQVINMYNKIKVDERVILALRGGFLNNVSYVKNSLIDTLNQHNINYVVDVNNNEPIMGAYYLALRSINSK